jgi:voltage-gated potassium channel
MKPTKARLAHIVFESDDSASRAFDVVLLVLIVASVGVALLDSVARYRLLYGDIFYTLEWIFTILFMVEYLLRLWLSRRMAGYAFSFYGIVDLLAILPAFLSLVVVDTQFLLVIRALRLLRILRIMKLGRYLVEATQLREALWASRRKIQIFIGTVLTIVLVMGTVMYIVEGPENGYTNIPISMYWAIVTLTTVGYGDITPLTPFGKFMASMIMMLGYGIIAVPTGIVTAEMTSQMMKRRGDEIVACPTCHAKGHDKDAYHCKYCGSSL